MKINDVELIEAVKSYFGDEILSSTVKCYISDDYCEVSFDMWTHCIESDDKLKVSEFILSRQTQIYDETEKFTNVVFTVRKDKNDE